MKLEPKPSLTITSKRVGPRVDVALAQGLAVEHRREVPFAVDGLHRGAPERVVALRSDPERERSGERRGPFVGDGGERDDGAVAEGYSESVARILVKRWDTLPKLASLAESDGKFCGFVMKHVDATLNTDDIERIRNNSKSHCPTGLRRLCDDLAKQADSAYKD